MNQDHSTKKPGWSEILLIGVAFFCYIGTLYFMITDNRLYLIVFFVLHSCLDIVSLLILRDKQLGRTLSQTETVPSRFEEEKEMMEAYDRKIAALKKERDSLLLEKEQLTTKCVNAELQVAQLQATLEQEKDSPESSREDTKLDHLLPQDEHPVDLNIIECAQNVMEEMEPFSKKSGIKLQLSSSDDSLMVRADASFIRLLFRNIVDNSIKYMKRNGSLVITISHIGDDLFIVLKDNGEGLPSNETNRIFELNYQGSNRISGNGLGLAQAKAIVEYYGGTIYAKSDSGKGMGIYIQLPATRF